MNIKKYTYSKIVLLVAIASIATISCERDFSAEVEFATFPKTGEIFLDAPIGLGSDFYFPYGGSKPTALSFNASESYEGTTSMRVDVPNADDPEGNYAGAILRIDGAGRDLTEFDALTFWTKASQGVVIGEFGFGEDFGENKFLTTLRNVSVGTNWQKVIIPIPDATKLLNERGMFRYATGTQDTGGFGYTFWIDELKFEKLGTVAQPQPAIVNGENVSEPAYTGIGFVVTGLTQTHHTTYGNITVSAAPSYFDFQSSNEDVAYVSELGVVTMVDEGTTTITAALGGVAAQGSLELTSSGPFNFAPTPTADPANVVSVFSDVYDNIPVDFYNGYWQPWQTTLSEDFSVSGDNILNYTNFNFVGNQFSNPTVDATELTHIHFDIFIPEGQSGQLTITLKDFGPDGADGGNDDTTQGTTLNSLVPNQWNSFDIPLTLANKERIGQIIYENGGSPLTNFWVDNIYFYK